jgi:hypothetical protein
MLSHGAATISGFRHVGLRAKAVTLAEVSPQPVLTACALFGTLWDKMGAMQSEEWLRSSSKQKHQPMKLVRS